MGRLTSNNCDGKNWGILHGGYFTHPICASLDHPSASRKEGKETWLCALMIDPPRTLLRSSALFSGERVKRGKEMF